MRPATGRHIKIRSTPLAPLAGPAKATLFSSAILIVIFARGLH